MWYWKKAMYSKRMIWIDWLRSTLSVHIHFCWLKNSFRDSFLRWFFQLQELRIISSYFSRWKEFFIFCWHVGFTIEDMLWSNWDFILHAGLSQAFSFNFGSIFFPCCAFFEFMCQTFGLSTFDWSLVLINSKSNIFMLTSSMRQMWVGFVFLFYLMCLGVSSVLFNFVSFSFPIQNRRMNFKVQTPSICNTRISPAPMNIFMLLPLFVHAEPLFVYTPSSMILRRFWTAFETFLLHTSKSRLFMLLEEKTTKARSNGIMIRKIVWVL